MATNRQDRRNSSIISALVHHITNDLSASSIRHDYTHDGYAQKLLSSVPNYHLEITHQYTHDMDELHKSQLTPANTKASEDTVGPTHGEALQHYKTQDNRECVHAAQSTDLLKILETTAKDMNIHICTTKKLVCNAAKKDWSTEYTETLV